MVLCTISVGRNVGGVPMDAERWEAFQRNTAAMVRLAFRMGGEETPYIDVKVGTAEWAGDPDEESCTVVGTGSNFDLRIACDGARNLRRTFGQESVFLGTGIGQLIRSEGGE